MRLIPLVYRLQSEGLVGGTRHATMDNICERLAAAYGLSPEQAVGLKGIVGLLPATGDPAVVYCAADAVRAYASLFKGDPDVEIAYEGMRSKALATGAVVPTTQTG